MPSRFGPGTTSISSREFMANRIHVTTFVLVAAAIWAVLLVLQGVAVTPEFFKPFGMVVGVLVLLLGAFEAFLWRIPWLHPWFVNVPNVRGTWRGSLVTSWTDPSKGQPPPPIEAYVSIHQTFSSIEIRLMTDESSSSLLSGSVAATPDGTYEVSGVYRNTPRISLRDRSPIHYGAILLRVIGSPPSALDGEYWTSRGTNGEMRLGSRISDLCQDFAEAQQRYGAVQPPRTQVP
jgi:hypothetical protein